MQSAVIILVEAIRIYSYIVLAMVIVSWLIGFDVINRRNQVVQTIWGVLHKLTEPLLGPIRRLLPPVSGIDFSPIVLLFALWALQVVILNNLV